VAGHPKLGSVKNARTGWPPHMPRELLIR